MGCGVARGKNAGISPLGRRVVTPSVVMTAAQVGGWVWLRRRQVRWMIFIEKTAGFGVGF